MSPDRDKLNGKAVEVNLSKRFSAAESQSRAVNPEVQPGTERANRGTGLSPQGPPRGPTLTALAPTRALQRGQAGC